MATQDEMVEAIRSCPLVGRGSCSTISECFGTNDLLKELAWYKVTTIEGAIKWALDFEEAKKEQALNQRWGSDTDWQLVAWNEWNEDRAAYEAAK
jgi:hypothetical protein